ncbi:MAG: CPBP family intramembrane metalloprotease [Nitrososphaerota archaeon]|nr:CPBP family intramembrane metalloprotease [Nitrososphaerota archaeon]
MTEEKARAGPTVAHRFGLFLLFLICGVALPSLSGLLIFPFSLIPLSWDWAYRITLTMAFLILSLVASRSGSYKKYWKVFFSFFIASFALNLQAIGGYFNFQSTPINNIVLSMLSSTILVVIPIIAFSLTSGDSLSTIFLTKGNLNRGLLIGSIGFIAFTLVSIPAATYLFQGKDLTVAKAISWSMPLLVTVFANGFREELLYRGLFLKKYEPLLGSRSSNLLQAIIFSLSHTVAGRGTIAYTQYTVGLVVFTFVLGLVWGFVMQKTNSILGSVLFHAGSDVSVFLGIFSNLP